jgi:predicted RND superfamily exporter protein
LSVETNALTYFRPDRPIRREYAAIEHEGYGLFGVELVVRSTDGVAIAHSSAVLEALRAFKTAARKRRDVTAVLSLADLLVDKSWRVTKRESLPDPSIIRDALSRDDVIELSRKLVGEGRGGAGRALRVTVLAKTRETPRLLELMAELRQDFEATAGRASLTADFTGSFPLLLETQLSLLDTLATSLGGAALTIGLTILVFVRSLRRALLAVLPNALPISLNFALMRVLDLPLDVGTVMTSSIVLGIAVDNTIHYFFHYGRAITRGETVPEAAATAARIAGRSLVLATAITVTGFLTLLLSSFAPTWRFGLLASFGLSVAVVGTIVVLPALLLLAEGHLPVRRAQH